MGSVRSDAVEGKGRQNRQEKRLGGPWSFGSVRAGFPELLLGGHVAGCGPKPTFAARG